MTQATPSGWRRDDRGDLYGPLTAGERAQIEPGTEEPADEGAPPDTPQVRSEGGDGSNERTGWLDDLEVRQALLAQAV